MTCPRLIRGLRIAWTAFCATLVVLLIALWVRSYSHPTGFMIAHGTRPIRVISNRGNVVVSTFMNDNMPPQLRASFAKLMETRLDELRTSGGSKFADPPNVLRGSWKEGSGVIPYWLLVSIVGPFAAVFAAVPWLPSKYSLRTLLIATTLVSTALGLIIALSR